MGQSSQKLVGLSAGWTFYQTKAFLPAPLLLCLTVTLLPTTIASLLKFYSVGVNIQDCKFLEILCLNVWLHHVL